MKINPLNNKGSDISSRNDMINLSIFKAYTDRFPEKPDKNYEYDEDEDDEEYIPPKSAVPRVKIVSPFPAKAKVIKKMGHNPRLSSYFASAKHDSNKKDLISKIESHIFYEDSLEICFEDMAGSKSIREKLIKEYILPYMPGNEGYFVGAREPGLGALLYGPSGTGKVWSFIFIDFFIQLTILFK